MIKTKETAKNIGVMFKASYGWRENFMKRQGFALRMPAITTHYDDKLLSLQCHVIKLRKEYKYCFSQIGNADETAIFFDMPRNYTAKKKKEKEIKI